MRVLSRRERVRGARSLNPATSIREKKVSFKSVSHINDALILLAYTATMR